MWVRKSGPSRSLRKKFVGFFVWVGLVSCVALVEMVAAPCISEILFKRSGLSAMTSPARVCFLPSSKAFFAAARGKMVGSLCAEEVVTFPWSW